ncbi:MAG: hypothetical protein BWY25_03072 [Chloroflexi bacterium ADurb.Bin222]|nr:MAG: hypothetical protein BWY25_03072 [Chloroflexi bacterium ADurb.Bin222]
MPVGDVLPVLDGEDVPQTPGFQNLVQGGEEGGIAQDVADLKELAGALGSLHELLAALARGRHGLFEEHIVARFQGGDCRGDVQGIEGANQSRGDRQAPRDQCLPGVELPFRGDAVGGSEARAAHGVRLGDCHETQFIGMCQGVGRVGFRAAIAGADQNRFDRLGHQAPQVLK